MFRWNGSYDSDAAKLNADRSARAAASGSCAAAAHLVQWRACLKAVIRRARRYRLSCTLSRLERHDQSYVDDNGHGPGCRRARPRIGLRRLGSA